MRSYAVPPRVTHHKLAQTTPDQYTLAKVNEAGFLDTLREGTLLDSLRTRCDLRDTFAAARRDIIEREVGMSAVSTLCRGHHLANGRLQF